MDQVLELPGGPSTGFPPTPPSKPRLFPRVFSNNSPLTERKRPVLGGFARLKTRKSEGVRKKPKPRIDFLGTSFEDSVVGVRRKDIVIGDRKVLKESARDKSIP